MEKTARVAIALGLAAAALGVWAAIRARRLAAPVREEALAYIRQYVLAPTTPYSKDLGKPLGIKEIRCERLYSTYLTLSDAAGGKNAQMVAVCHADVQFSDRDAAVAINISRPADKPGRWNVYKFEIAGNPP